MPRLSQSPNLTGDPPIIRNEAKDDQWVAIRIPHSNTSARFSVDFIDESTEDGKEWLDGPCDLDLTIRERLAIREEGRASRLQRSMEPIPKDKERGGRIKITKRKPTPARESLRRSIAPGFSSWEPREPNGIDRQIQEQEEMRRSSSSSSTIFLYSPTYAGDFHLWKLPSKYTILNYN